MDVTENDFDVREVMERDRLQMSRRNGCAMPGIKRCPSGFVKRGSKSCWQPICDRGCWKALEVPDQLESTLLQKQCLIRDELAMWLHA